VLWRERNLRQLQIERMNLLRADVANKQRSIARAEAERDKPYQQR